MRFDKFVAEKLNISRNQASELIKNEKILLDNEICNDTAKNVENGEISVASEIYVSRGALKLKGFLRELKDDFSFEINGLNALDVGSSTGGFVQILLENGVKSVTALDVGSMQLSEILRNNPRVKVCENTDIREFKSEKFDLITCDVSFISLNSILENIFHLAKKYIILLFKPQFEVGINAKRDKKGVVKDEKAIKKSVANFELNCAKMGLIKLAFKECQIKGKNGNQEFFYLYEKPNSEI